MVNDEERRIFFISATQPRGTSASKTHQPPLFLHVVLQLPLQ